jgi:hypothetical protein
LNTDNPCISNNTVSPVNPITSQDLRDDQHFRDILDLDKNLMIPKPDEELKESKKSTAIFKDRLERAYCSDSFPSDRFPYEEIAKSFKERYPASDFNPDDFKLFLDQAFKAASLIFKVQNYNDDLTFSLIGRKLSHDEILELELSNLKRFFDAKRKIIDESFAMVQVSELLALKEQEIFSLVKNSYLLGFVDSDKTWYFPKWQFDSSQPGGMLADLHDVLISLDISLIAKITWITSPNLALGDNSPLDYLRDGKSIAEVVELAQTVGVK